jgi:hypothetical protein
VSAAAERGDEVVDIAAKHPVDCQRERTVTEAELQPVLQKPALDERCAGGVALACH